MGACLCDVNAPHYDDQPPDDIPPIGLVGGIQRAGQVTQKHKMKEQGHRKSLCRGDIAPQGKVSVYHISRRCVRYLPLKIVWRSLQCTRKS